MQVNKRVFPYRSVVMVVVVVLAAILGYVAGQTTVVQMRSAPVTVPLVVGYYNGQEILFTHTEASDQQVASMLSAMMASPVILVPSLNQIPSSLLGDVYVFKNGVKATPSGPFGFQPDVFSSVPSDKDYTPLRVVNLVTWKDGSTPRVLKSVDEIQQAAAKGEVTITRTDIVVNMPIVKWPGGQR